MHACHTGLQRCALPPQCSPTSCCWLAAAVRCPSANVQLVPSISQALAAPQCSHTAPTASGKAVGRPATGPRVAAAAATAWFPVNGHSPHTSAFQPHIPQEPSPAPTPAAAAAAAGSPGSAAADAESLHNKGRLYALYGFVSAHGRLPCVQDSHQGVAVGQWAEKCKQQQQQGTLALDLAEALQSIPGWSWQPQLVVLAEQFDRSVAQLRAYTLKHGLPPMRGGPSKREGSSNGVQPLAPVDDPVAATKLRVQLFEQRKRGVLTQQQVDAVTASVPGWRWDARVRAPPLDVMVQLLTDFHHQHGRLPKGEERLPDGFLIGEWCGARRSEYSRGLLETDVAAALEQVPNWSWNAQDSMFETHLELLVRFVAQHGRVPTQREALDGVRLGSWCNKRRLQYKQGGLPADRVAALEAVPGWWWSADQMPEQ